MNRLRSTSMRTQRRSGARRLRYFDAIDASPSAETLEGGEEQAEEGIENEDVPELTEDDFAQVLSETMAELAKKDPSFAKFISSYNDLMAYFERDGKKDYTTERQLFADARESLDIAYAQDLEQQYKSGSEAQGETTKHLLPCRQRSTQPTCDAQYGVFRVRERDVVPLYARLDEKSAPIPRCLFARQYVTSECQSNTKFWDYVAREIEKYAPLPYGQNQIPAKRVLLAPYSTLVYEVLMTLPGFRPDYDQVRQMVEILLADQQMLLFYHYYRLWRLTTSSSSAVKLSSEMLLRIQGETDPIIRTELPLGIRVYALVRYHETLDAQNSPIRTSRSTLRLELPLWTAVVLLVAFLPVATASGALAAPNAGGALATSSSPYAAETSRLLQARVAPLVQQFQEDEAALANLRSVPAVQKVESAARTVSETQRAALASYSVLEYEKAMSRYQAQNYPGLPATEAWEAGIQDAQQQVSLSHQTIQWVEGAVRTVGDAGTASYRRTVELTIRSIIARDLGRNFPLYNAFRTGNNVQVRRLLEQAMERYQSEFAADFKEWRVEPAALQVETWEELLGPNSLEFDRIFNPSVWVEVETVGELLDLANVSMRQARQIAGARRESLEQRLRPSEYSQSQALREQVQIESTFSISVDEQQRITVLLEVINDDSVWTGNDAAVRTKIDEAVRANYLARYGVLPGESVLRDYSDTLWTVYLRKFQGWTKWFLRGSMSLFAALGMNAGNVRDASAGSMIAKILFKYGVPAVTTIAPFVWRRIIRSRATPATVATLAANTLVGDGYFRQGSTRTPFHPTRWRKRVLSYHQ